MRHVDWLSVVQVRQDIPDTVSELILVYEDTRFTRWCREYGYDLTSAEAEAAWLEHERQRLRFEGIAAAAQ